MTADQLRSVIRALVYATVFLVPTWFWRGVNEAFDLTKGVLFGSLAILLLAALLALAIADPRGLASRLTWIAVVPMTLAVVVTTITSSNPLQSFYGAPQRYTGTTTLLGCLILVVAITAVFNRDQLVRLAQVMAASMLVVVGYGTLQEFGADPYDWFAESFGKLVFATMGNPNTAAGYTGIMLPVVAWAMLRSAHPTWMRAVSGAVFGGAIGTLAAYVSFQGPVAALATILYLVLWAWWNGRTLGAWSIAAVGSIAIVVVSTRERLSWGGLLILGTAVAFCLVGIFAPRIIEWRLPGALAARRRLLAGIGLALVVVIAVFAGPRVARTVEDGIAGGMLERGDFYRAAIGVVEDHPVLGTGPDTFGYFFTEYRPAGHAERLEFSRTSSVHSVPLGMFTSGGVVLGASYLLLVAMVAFVFVRGLIRDPMAGSGAFLGAGAAWVASILQSLVSVEHVALLMAQFALAAVVLAFGAPALVTASASAKGRASRARTVPAVLVGLLGAAALVGIWFATLPTWRGATAAFAAQGAAASQDLIEARQQWVTATDEAPWVVSNWVGLASTNQALGRSSDAADAALEASRRAGYGVIGFNNFMFVAEDGDARAAAGDTEGALVRFSQAVEIVRRGIDDDPFAASLKQQAAAWYVLVAERVAQLGDTGQAQSLLDQAEEYEPGSASVSAVRDQLGL